MREKPILFSAPMVRAILDGRKTQTRRVLPHGKYRLDLVAPADGGPSRCPFGQPGDRLWVREAHAIVPRTAYARSEGVEQVLRPDDDHDACVFREGWERSRPGRWRPSIHMPRWASRISLEITGVRVERLQDISEADARAEGVERTVAGDGWRRYYPDAAQEAAGLPPCHTATSSFSWLWESIHGRGAWAANPWVWAVEFRRVDGAKEASE